eukprot:SAG11_NODE_45_length_20574_cov_8.004054_2_plen_1080_part_00
MLAIPTCSWPPLCATLFKPVNSSSLAHVLPNCRFRIKYAEFPDDLDIIRAKLHSKVEAAVRTGAEMLERAKQTNDIRQIDAAIALYEEGGERLAIVMSATKSHRTELVNVIKKDLATALESDNPEEVQAAILSSEYFGDEVRAERGKAQAKLDSLVGTIVTRLRELAGSDNFTDISEALLTYEKFSHDLKKNWSMQMLTLQQRRDELVDDVTASLRKLKLESDPARVAEGLEMFKEYDEVVVMEKDALRDRLRILLEGAILDIRNAMKDENHDLELMQQILEKYQDYPDRVRELLTGLQNKKESIVLAADRYIRKFLASTDIEEINKVIAEHLPNEPFLKDALGALTNHRLDLEDDMRDKIKVAITSDDPQAVQELLFEAQSFGKGVQEEVQRLEECLAGLYDRAVDEIQDLLASKDFAAVSAASKRYASSPPPVAERWRLLQDHIQTLIYAAKEDIGILCEAERPMAITAGLPKFNQYGEHLADERNAALASYSNLIDAARAELEIWIDRPDATIHEMTKIVQKYSEHPDEIARLRSRLDKKVASSIRIAEKTIRASLIVDDIAKVDAVLSEFEPASKYLGPVLEELTIHRHHLVGVTAEKLQTFLMTEPTPGDIQVMKRSCAPFATLVSAELDALQRKYDELVQAAVDDLLALIGIDDMVEINAALNKYKGYPDEVLVHWGTLQQHRDNMVRTARLKVREVATSVDPREITQAINKFASFGEAVETDIQSANLQMLKLVDAARTEILSLTMSKATTMGKLDATLTKYANYPDALSAEKEALQKRIDFLSTLKARLREVCLTCHPQDIQIELDRYADYGPAIVEERQLLEDRFSELVQNAREELRNLISDRTGGVNKAEGDVEGSPKSQLMELALSKYKNYPQLADLYTQLRNKYEAFTQTTTKRLSRLYATDDIAEIDAALAEHSQSGHSLAALLLSLQRRRMQLCDEMGVRLKAGLQSQVPADIIRLLEDAAPYGGDVDNERHVLSEHLHRLVEKAVAELQHMMHSDNSREIEAILSKYKEYPSEVLSGPWTELQVHKESLRRTIIGKVEGAMNSMDTNLIDGLLSQLLSDFGNEM